MDTQINTLQLALLKQFINAAKYSPRLYTCIHTPQNLKFISSRNHSSIDQITSQHMEICSIYMSKDILS